MASLEDIQPNTAIRGVIPDALVTVANVTWHGTDSLELIYKDPSGAIGTELLFRHDEERLEIVEVGRPWSLDGDHGQYAWTAIFREPWNRTVGLVIVVLLVGGVLYTASGVLVAGPFLGVALLTYLTLPTIGRRRKGTQKDESGVRYCNPVDYNTDSHDRNLKASPIRFCP